jgi:nucleoside phosphorylase
LWIANAAVIAQVHATTGSSDEEMEAFGFGVTSYRLGIPFIKIAVISDSDVTGSQFTYDTVRISMTNGISLLLEMLTLSKGRD